MNEILISHPVLNETPERYRRYTYDGSMVRRTIERRLKDSDITPLTHPQVVDLYAGDGSMARIMAELGWNEKNIVCIDSHISPAPLITRAKWMYWDLNALARQIIRNITTPPEIAVFQGKFDISLSLYGEPDPFNKARVVRDWFAREGAFVV